MGFTAVAGGKAFKRVPEGVHVARCVKIIDLGHQDVEFGGETKCQHKVQIVWEVLGEDENGVPMSETNAQGVEEPLQISKRYTLSLHQKSKMRADLEAWRGKGFSEEDLKGFDVSKLLGAYCMLNVTHSQTGEKVYANVQSITPLPRAMPKPPSATALVLFDVEKPDMAVFSGFHEKLQDTIRASEEWKTRAASPAAQAPAKVPLEEMLDDVPF